MRKPHFSEQFKNKLKKLIHENPEITATEIGEKLGKVFNKKQLKSIGNLKMNMKSRGEFDAPLKVINKSILSDEEHEKLLQIISKTPNISASDIAEKIGVTDPKKIKSIYNTKHYMEIKKPKNDNVVKVNRVYTKRVSPVVVHIHGTFSERDNLEDIVKIIESIAGVTCLQIAGKVKTFELREAVPT